MTYTILFGLDNRHFNLTNIKIGEERRFHYQLGDTIYVYEATLKQVTSEPTAKSTGSGIVTVKALHTSYNADIICNIAKKSIRDTVKAKIEEIAGTNHKEWCVQSHRSHTHQWVEVYPDGTVCETEEADDNTGHYLEYPNRPVATLLEIASSSSGYCDCDVCCAIKRYEEYLRNEMDAEEFNQLTGYDAAEFDEYSLHDLYEDHELATSEWDYVEEMLDALESIEYGYFDDEE